MGLYANTGVCDINGKSPDGDTPLHLAVFLGKAEMVRILLDNGANTSIKNSHGNTAIEWAEATGNDEIQFLLEQSIKKASQANILSLFNWETEEEFNNGIDMEKLKMLIDAGADVNVKDDDGYTALHYATRLVGCIASFFNPYLVHLLLEAGADVNAKDDDGKTPLDNILISHSGEFYNFEDGKQKRNNCFDYDVSVIDMLIEAGSDVTHSLQYAIGKDKTYVLKKLINAGADVANAQTTPQEHNLPGYHSTPLHLAIELFRIEDTKTLIKAGADVNAKDSQERMSLAMVATHLIRLVDTEKEANDVIEIIEMIIEKGADVNIRVERADMMLIDYLLLAHDRVPDETTNPYREIYRPDLIRKTYKDITQILIEAGATQ